MLRLKYYLRSSGGAISSSSGGSGGGGAGRVVLRQAPHQLLLLPPDFEPPGPELVLELGDGEALPIGGGCLGCGGGIFYLEHRMP